MALSGTSTSTGSAPGFLSTTVRLCAGTEILTEIYTSSPARAIWRFFLLTLLCSIMAAVVGTFVQKGAFERAGRNLDEEIGAFVVTPETISLQKDPDTPRRLKLPYIMLEYYPGNTFTDEDFNVGRTSEHGVVILPGGLASWAMVNWKGEDLFYANLLPAPMLYAWLDSGEKTDKADPEAGPPAVPRWEMFSGPGLSETLKKEFSTPEAKHADDGGKNENARAVLATGSQAARYALSMLTAIILLTTFARNFLEIGLLVLLVSLVQYLRASTLPKGLIFKNVLTIMVYSTFPAQIAATLFDAAGGDRFISFQLLFVGIFFVYQLFAFRAVIRKICPQPEKNDDDFDDSGF
jgi:hypothetical protein